MTRYAAFGTADTPPDMLAKLGTLATMLAMRGMTLCTSPESRAPGGWAAFEALCDGCKALGGARIMRTPTIHVRAMEVASAFNSDWQTLDRDNVQQFAAGQTLSMLSDTFDSLPLFVLCYATTAHQMLRIAAHYNVPVFNLAQDGAEASMWQWLATQ